MKLGISSEDLPDHILKGMKPGISSEDLQGHIPTTHKTRHQIRK